MGSGKSGGAGASADVSNVKGGGAVASAGFAAELFRGFKVGEVFGVFPVRDTFCVVWVVCSTKGVSSIRVGGAVFWGEKEIRLDIC